MQNIQFLEKEQARITYDEIQYINILLEEREYLIQKSRINSAYKERLHKVNHELFELGVYLDREMLGIVRDRKWKKEN